MTKKEAAIISAYTGILIGKFCDLYEYLQEKAGRPIFTHELIQIDAKGLSHDDFLKISVD